MSDDNNVENGEGRLAIVGMGALFPEAEGLQSYWSNLREGVDCIKRIPQSHWRPEDYFDTDASRPDFTYAERGGFLPAMRFNPMEFGVSPNALEATDSAQLLGLMVARRTLDDAGYGKDANFDRSRASVVLGVTGTLQLVIPLGARLGHPIWRKALKDAGIDTETAEDVVDRIADQYVGWKEDSFPGLLGNVVAGRIANRLDLHGTNCVVDAACASSLSALHLAAMELQTGKSDIVITGGVDTFNDIFMYMCFSKTPALSASGNARPFDVGADGTILGEGIGMFAIKRLADAERDNDRIYAVIRGIGSSSDGKGEAIYAPAAAGQVRCLQNAYERAGVSPSTVELVEGHGTGTRVGDATEVKGLTEVFQSARAEGTWCALGSVKSQIGHTKAAAGSAGILKTAMALYRKVLPPTIKVNRPPESLAEERTPFYVNTEKRPWLPREEHPRRAGVSSFGFGGSNFHCVLEEYETRAPSPDWDGDVHVLPFSADRPEDLEAVVRRWRADLPEDGSDLRGRAAAARADFDPSRRCRLVLVVERGVTDLDHLVEGALQQVAKRGDIASWSTPDGAHYGSGKDAGQLGILFPGQGSQYVGMQRDLACRFPQMQDVLAEADRAFADSVEGEHRLSDRIYPHPVFDEVAATRNEAALRATDVAQPAIGAVSLGALRVLESFGLKGDAVAGHSYGELLALHAAGRYDAEALHRLSGLRGRLMVAGSRDLGGMLAVQAPLETVEAVLREEKLELVVANRNAPEQAVVSGATTEIERAVVAFERQSVRSKRLSVSAAFHSPLVAHARGPMRDALGDMEFGDSHIPVFSNGTAERYPEGADEARETLAGQLAQPVEFVSIVENMYETGVHTFVEVGPGSRLGSLVGSILKGKPHEVVSLDASSGRRSGMVDLGHCLARLAALGHDVDLARWDPVDPVRGAVEAPSRPAWTVDLSGANYVKPKEAKPPRAVRPATPTTRPATPVAPVSDDTPVGAGPDPARPVADEPTPGMNPPRRPSVPVQPAVTEPSNIAVPSDPDALASALELTRQNLDALVRMQQQAADMHRLFLEGQDRVRQSMEAMLHGQLRALGVEVPAPVSSVPSMPVANASDATRVGAGHDPARPVAHNPTPGMDPSHTHSESARPTMDEPSKVAAADVAAPSDEIASVLLEAVADKTGYPVEMLDLDMGMDADLGIDSIKRVEILSAIQDRLPGLPAVKPDVMGSLRTLRDIVELLGAAGASSQGNGKGKGNTASAAPAASPDMEAGEIGTVLLEAVADRTGYPVEMLGLEMALDADLGIDSIKRVEILSNVQDRLPNLPAVKPDRMGTFRTLGDIVTFLVTEGAGDAATPVATDEPAPRPPTEATPGGSDGLQRFVVRSVPSSGINASEPIDVPEGSVVWITDDGGDFAPALAKALEARGLRPEIVPTSGKTEEPPAGLGGLILLLPTGERCDGRLGDALALLRRTGAGLRRAAEEGGAFLGAVQRLDGAFGFGDGGGTPSSGGLSGLLKTAAREWPEIPARAFDVAETVGDKAAAASVVADGLLHRGPVEMGVSDSGASVIETKAAPLPSEEREGQALGAEDVVVLSGGARGVTAACAIAIARRWKPKLVLLGRSPAPEEEEVWLAGLETEAAVKRALAERGEKRPSPKEIEAAWRTISASRAIRATLERIDETGARAVYRQVDVRDAGAVATVLQAVREDLGPVRGVIHGAGVLADARIEDKTADQFDRVYGTKVDGARALLEATRDDDLRVLVMFSSTTARLGRVAQSDYAMANEVLNKMAQEESRRRPACRVMSLNWGPWEGGMVTPALARVFAAEGVGLIGLAAGADLMVREIATRDPGDGPAEVVVLGPDPGGAVRSTLEDEDVHLTTAFELTVDADRVPVLRSHVLGGRAVVPAALMVEWLAHGALHGNPGLSFHGVDDMRVLKGIILDGAPVRVSVHAGRAREKDGRRVVPVELRGTGADGAERLHARARIVLVRRLPTGELSAPAPSVEAWSRTVDEAYAELLFHGEDLHAVTSVKGIGPAGIVATTAPTPSPRNWIDRPLRSSWLAEPMALDAAFQALILWSQEVRGAPSLPTGFARFRQYRRRFPKEGVTVHARVVRDRESEIRSDIEFVDGAGNLVARMEGYDCVVDPSLHASFRERRLGS